MIGFEEQKKLFELIGKECRKRTEVLVIGGSAMLFYEFSKSATKDIDIVLPTGGDRKFFIRTLKRIGFKLELEGKVQGTPCRFVLGDYILDVFAGSVFRMRLSEGMLGRVKERIEFGNLVVSVISPEDIILSKSMTDRVGDRQDAASILREANVNWDAILQECEWQSRNGDPRFSVFLYDFLDDLVHDFGADIPKDAVVRIKKLHKEFLGRLDMERGS